MTREDRQHLLVATFLRKARMASGNISQHRLALEVENPHLVQSSISKIERGVIWPSTRALQQLADGLDLDVSLLRTGKKQ